VAVVAMTISFAIFEAFLPEILNLLEPLLQREIGGFPGTLMIILGWIPVVAGKILNDKKPWKALKNKLLRGRKQKQQDREMDQKIGNDVLPEQGT